MRLTTFAAALVVVLAMPRSARADESFAHVHVDSDGPVVLTRRHHDGWATACRSPCDAWLSLGSEYRVSTASGGPSEIGRAHV